MTTTTAAAPAATTTRSRRLVHGITTGLAAFFLVATGVTDLVRAPSVMAGLAHLGYPAYLATILGVWKVLGAAAIVAPRLRRLKEWAYAGIFFDLTGAALSHAAAGDGRGDVLLPLVVLGVVAASWRAAPSHSAGSAAGSDT